MKDPDVGDLLYIRMIAQKIFKSPLEAFDIERLLLGRIVLNYDLDQDLVKQVAVRMAEIEEECENFEVSLVG